MFRKILKTLYKEKTDWYFVFILVTSCKNDFFSLAIVLVFLVLLKYSKGFSPFFSFRLFCYKLFSVSQVAPPCTATYGI